MDKRRFLPRARVVNRVDHILRYAAGQSVLHIGMGGFVDDEQVTKSYLRSDLSETLHGRLWSVAEHLTGADINPMIIDAFSKEIPCDYLLCDITDPTAHERFSRQFDVIVFSDVIEHLDAVRPAIQNLRRLMTLDGRTIITTVNAFGIDRFLKMLLRYESVHPEHTAYYSYSTMQRLLEMSELSISAFTYYSLPIYGSPLVPRSLLGRLSFHFSRLVNTMLPQFAEGLIFVVDDSSPITDSS